MTDQAVGEPTAVPGDATRQASTSWVDRVQDWLEAGPLPWWTGYVLAFGLVQLLGHLARWADGSLPAGVLDPARNPMYGAFYPTVLFWAIHSLDRLAERRLPLFAAAAGIPAPEVDRLARELTTMPSRPVAWLTLAGTLPGAALYLLTSGVLGAIDSSPPVVAVSVVLVALSLTGLLLFVYHALHQLSAVTRLHAAASRIDPLASGDLFAFSSLSVRTGLVIIVVAWYALFVRPDLVVDGGPLALAVIAAMLSAGALTATMPLLGIHRRLAGERDRLLAEADRRISATIERTWAAIDAESTDRSAASSAQLAAAIQARDLVRATPTWPWRPGAIAAFGSTVVLPLVIWAVTQYADRVLFR